MWRNMESQNPQKYCLKQLVGQGQFGKVYRAIKVADHWDQEADPSQCFAAKVISHSKFRKNKKLKHLVFNQMKILSGIQHPNIIHLEQTFIKDNNFHMIYEFCEGGTLDQILPLAEDRLLPIFTQILNACAEAERKNVLHRDLKPANILFKDGKVKVADWGFSRILLKHQTAESFIGSPAYMAPQVLRQEEYTSKADVWSLGVLIYEALYGQCPWRGKNIEILFQNINNRPLSFPPSVNISKSLRRIITQMLNPKEDKRPDFHSLKKMLKLITEPKIQIGREAQMFVKMNSCHSVDIISSARSGSLGPKQKKSLNQKDLKYFSECTFLLQMAKSIKSLTRSKQASLIFFRQIMDNLERLKDRCVLQRSIPALELIRKEMEIVRRLQQDACCDSIPKLSPKATDRRFDQFKQPKSINPQSLLAQSKGSSVEQLTVKHVSDEIWRHVQSDTKRKTETQKKEAKSRLVELNCLLDLVVYKYLTKEYNVKPVRMYVGDLREASRSALLKLLNHKMELVSHEEA